MIKRRDARTFFDRLLSEDGARESLTAEDDHREAQLQAGRSRFVGEALQEAGAELIAITRYGANEAIVLARRYHAADQFATWQFNGRAGLFWGHHFRSENDARADFVQRVAVGMIQLDRDNGPDERD